MEEHDIRKTLWYRRPADNWIEGLPLGNGRLGVMVEGGVNRDHMYINEESVWLGHPDDCIRTDARDTMKEIQKCLFAGESEQVEALVMEGIMPEKRWFGSYQALGELTVQNLEPVEFDDYERVLDLDTGTVQVEYTEDERFLGDQEDAGGGAKTPGSWKREYFVSAPHQAAAVRYTCPAGKKLNLEVTLSREEYGQVTAGEPGSLILEGRCGGDGIHFSCVVQVVPQGGTMQFRQLRQTARPTILIHGADVVDIFLAGRTDFRCGENGEDGSSAESCSRDLVQCMQECRMAAEESFETVREKHVEEYQGYYSRFELELDDGCQDEVAGLDTYQRLRRLRRGGKDENFYALLVHYHRYLLLSASRPGCLPSNLQGLWNYQMVAPWESDYHANINLQINYWPSEAYNLSECQTALFDWLEQVSVSGARTAADYYGAGGWTLHHASNVFGHTAPCAVPAGLWPLGAAWLSCHLHEHYLYTGDEEFLNHQAWPLMKGAAQFLIDFLQEAPEGVEGAGYLVTNPSHSPENKFYTRDGKFTTFTYGATMDFEIIRDLFGRCLKVIEHIPAQEQDFEARLRYVLEHIPPIRISEKTGGIQEWIGDYDEVDPGHRHVSHLYGVFPGRMITLEKTPELAQAAKRSLERKLANNYDGQGWSYGWMSCLWTRLGEPQKAYEALTKIVERHAQHNLFLEAHGKPQVGDAQAIPMAILEMLAQFDGEKVKLLPALPREWRSGRVKGLRLVGGTVIDMTWRDGRVIDLVVHDDETFCRYPLEVSDLGQQK